MSEQQHWNTIYGAKEPGEMSWTQQVPQTALEMIRSLNLDKGASIIDVGGGDSTLADHLLEEGFSNLTVLDISAVALEKAKNRLGNKADKVKWIVADVTAFDPTEKYDLWHDRATFHFLRALPDIGKYRQLVRNAVSGYLIISTFSLTGPPKCSGKDVTRYDADTLAILFSDFCLMHCINQEHKTPFGTTQNFIYCCFQKKT